jgi:hypothetical protein
MAVAQELDAALVPLVHAAVGGGLRHSRPPSHRADPPCRGRRPGRTDRSRRAGAGHSYDRPRARVVVVPVVRFGDGTRRPSVPCPDLSGARPRASRAGEFASLRPGDTCGSAAAGRHRPVQRRAAHPPHGRAGVRRARGRDRELRGAGSRHPAPVAGRGCPGPRRRAGTVALRTAARRRQTRHGRLARRRRPAAARFVRGPAPRGHLSGGRRGPAGAAVRHRNRPGADRAGPRSGPGGG